MKNFVYCNLQLNFQCQSHIISSLMTYLVGNASVERGESVETGSQGQRDPLGDEIGGGEHFSLTKSHAKEK